MANLKKLSQKEELLTSGHRLCSGCAASIAVRQILLASDTPVVAGASTGCFEVATTIYPYTAWNTPFIHNAFENVAATISGAETAYRALKKKGKITKDINFIAFGGDGGTYDIGIQSLSGVLERGHRMVYVCYDNQAYMNTGIQRSGATPRGATTTTAPAGKKITLGKREYRKDLTAIVAAHNIPYVAQACPSYWNDLIKKSEKAFAADGPAFLNVLAPCPRGWRYNPEETIEIGKLAVQTCIWPLYEIVDGKTRLTYKPREKKPVTDWFKSQGRFKHLFSEENKKYLDEIQERIDKNWENLLKSSEDK
jgi:pyruvate ferredoxin oxidoreductase beta subunit